MAGFVNNIEQLTQQNDFFRKVLYTTPKTQLVVMSLKPSEDIGMETHPNTDQFIRIEKGKGVVELNGEKSKLEDGVAVVIPAGTKHNITNMSRSQPMKLYTIYTPPEHKPGTQQIDKPKHE